MCVLNDAKVKRDAHQTHASASVRGGIRRRAALFSSSRRPLRAAVCCVPCGLKTSTFIFCSAGISTHHHDDEEHDERRAHTPADIGRHRARFKYALVQQKQQDSIGWWLHLSLSSYRGMAYVAAQVCLHSLERSLRISIVRSLDFFHHIPLCPERQDRVIVHCITVRNGLYISEQSGMYIYTT